jgi:hypothetical protein
MTEHTKPQPALVGDTLYQLVCQYHGQLGSVGTSDEANTAALEHISTDHSDSEGNVAAGASVLITTLVQVTTAHLMKQLEARKAGKSSPLR